MSDLHPLSGAYAVDALDDLERARFERHLPECPDCAAEVQSLQQAAGLLALTADPTPPADLRSRVLAEIHTVRPLPPTAPKVEVPRRTARRFPQLVAAAVAALVLVGGGLAAVHPWSNSGAAPVAVSAQVMHAPDARTQSRDLKTGGSAKLYHSASVGRAVVVTKDLPPAPSGKVYELWFQGRDSSFIPAGLIKSDGSHTYVLSGKIRDSHGVGITLEPVGGSEHPTSAPVAMFDMNTSA